MTSLEALIALNMAASIGSSRLNKLLEYFCRPEDIFGASAAELIKVSGIGENSAGRICSFKKEDLVKELRDAAKLGLKIIALTAADYPENLKHIPGAPIVLYVKGEIRPEDKLAIGIVGSRQASFYGLSAAEKFASALAAKGFTIVSGMARGVDTASHRGALKAGGRTLAVMGSGFKHIYPDENKELAEEISQAGAVISEFPLNEQPLKENFPRRNRIISGLSLGLLVAEAARNSGALITADFALEQGREVFALPGKIDSSSSFGTNNLIKQGAKLVTEVEDILEEFDLMPPSPEKEGLNPEYNLKHGNENRLYDLITSEAVSLEELIEKANMDIPEISAILLNLQLRKLIRQLPGKQFVRSA
ncbi:MAG: DNA-processing protein DprA [Candidatus Omnitrophica bacterium]|nr:DNA-processing protein DprA [Candidatus Omnitrophota bacterium]